MLLAVLEKRVGFELLQKDVFVNIAGGIKVNDPAIDLAVLVSVLSSNMDIAIDEQTCVTGEVGLAGEIRPVNRIDQRIREAEKLGFEQIIIPSGQKYTTQGLKIKVVEVSRVVDAFKRLLKQ
jgi:DNA repair protein RadA/Sms